MKETYKRFLAGMLAICLVLSGGLPARAAEVYENDNVYQFVTRLYNVVLEREPDAQGLEAWYGQLVHGGQTGAQVVRDFLFSQEFEQKNSSNEQFLTVLYRAMFGREPDETGFAQWLAQLYAGVSRLTVCKGFVDSVEFQKLCDQYGIIKGTIESNEDGQQIYLVDQFVRRLYVTALGREADPSGLEAWKQVLLEHNSSGAEVVNGFIFSTECNNKNFSDDAFVRLLYNALFDRNADEAGLQNWLYLLSHGLTRQYICNGFINSQEFNNLCARYNIVKGTTTSENIRDKNETLTIFAADMYLVGLSRTFSTSELENVLSSLLDRKTTGYDYVKTFLNSEEYIGKNTSNESFMSLIFDVILKMSKETPEYTQGLSLLNSGTSRSDVLDKYLLSDIFIERCNQMGIQSKGRIIDPDKPMVALTFDDGPSVYTPRVLDCLEQYGQTATFFVVGYNASRYGSYIQRAYDLGCEIGNHSNTHADLTRLSANAVSNELSATNGYIRNAIGANATVIRTPGGSYNGTVCSVAPAPIIMWSLDTLDWKTRNTQKTVDAVLNNVKDGDIVLMHDIHKPTVAAAETIIPELISRGYQLVTVSELAQYRGGMEKGKVYFSFR